jgi:hypothetical protein
LRGEHRVVNLARQTLRGEHRAANRVLRTGLEARQTVLSGWPRLVS